MSRPVQDETELYPWRWKLADAAEDIFVLHRGKAIAALIAACLLVVLLGHSLLSDDSGDQEPNLTSPTSTAPESATPTTLPDDGLQTTSTEQIEVVPLDRAVPDSSLETAAHGPLILVNPGSAILSGGLTTDTEADAMVSLAEIIFPGWDIQDQQQVNSGFQDSGPIIARMQSRRLFEPDSADINPEFHAAIDQIGVFLVVNPGSQITVVGYGDDVEDADGLAAERAARVAQRLRAAGVPAESIDIIGPGEEPPGLPKGLTESPGAVDFYLS